MIIQTARNVCARTVKIRHTRCNTRFRRRGKAARASGRRSNEPPETERDRRGFTLIELLVVIAIISLLVAISVPSIALAQELARRAICAANLHGIGQGLSLYAQDNKSYPYVPLSSWNAAVGTNRDVDPFAAGLQARNATSNLYLLVRSNFCQAGMFICPSSRERADSSSSMDNWDFSDGTHVSYALMNPYGDFQYFADNTPGGVILLADGSPYFDRATGLRNAVAPVDLNGNPTQDEIEQGNSLNHAGIGQNVAGVNGAAYFEKRADVGSGRDNIYTRSDIAGKGDPAGSIPAPGADAGAADQGPANRYDSYLLP